MLMDTHVQSDEILTGARWVLKSRSERVILVNNYFKSHLRLF